MVASEPNEFPARSPPVRQLATAPCPRTADAFRSARLGKARLGLADCLFVKPSPIAHRFPGLVEGMVAGEKTRVNEP